MLLVGGARPAGRAPGSIAFARADGIYTMAVDGSDVRRLMHVSGAGPVPIRWLAWSHDGKRLAYWMRGQIWVMNADGTQNKALVGTPTTRFGGGLGAASPASPTWSPDGRRIAYTDGYESRSLWVTNADGSGKHQVATLGRYPAVELDWSPSGRRFAFTRWEWGESASDLNLMDADGRHQRLLRPAPVGFAANPDWSPDGRDLAFTHHGDRRTNATQIAVVSPGHALRRLTTGPASSFDPAWSPDGRQIAFVVGPAVEGLTSTLRAGNEIYLMDADGTHLRRLTNNRIGEASPAWRPTS